MIPLNRTAYLIVMLTK